MGKAIDRVQDDSGDAGQLSSDEQERIDIWKDMMRLYHKAGDEFGALLNHPDDILLTMRKDRLNGLHTRLANLVAALQYLNGKGQGSE